MDVKLKEPDVTNEEVQKEKRRIKRLCLLSLDNLAIMLNRELEDAEKYDAAGVADECRSMIENIRNVQKEHMLSDVNPAQYCRKLRQTNA